MQARRSMQALPWRTTSRIALVLLIALVGTRKTAAQIHLASNDLHPDVLHSRFFGPEPASDEVANRLRAPFHALKNIFINRQVSDDNFTLRVYDMRNGEAVTLEVITLADEKDRYVETGEADWVRIDRKRREYTKRLVDKWEDRGIPRKSIAVKWGRRNQVVDARIKEAITAEYEIRLARLMGLSLLAAEIGNVETFNVDSLVSARGARGRYQLMPYTLKQFDINEYWLTTVSGRRVRVKEELHPLLTMEPAFIWLKAYTNAVGHEIPGLLAYHSGPGTVFRIYRMFLRDAKHLHGPGNSVDDAFIWALTEGYEEVARRSRFGPYGRGYVLSAYGSLQAFENVPFNTSQTLQVDRLQLRSGTSTTLAELLDALEGSRLRWASGTESFSLYERFRRINSHMGLPKESNAQGVPAAGNVQLRSKVGGEAIRFFLPLGAVEVLKGQGLRIIDEEVTYRFGKTTYRLPDANELTEWDRAYADLVNAVSRFGFSLERRAELRTIKNRFEQLAEETPTNYRRRQLAVISHHVRLWDFDGWEELAAMVESRSVEGASNFGAQ